MTFPENFKNKIGGENFDESKIPPKFNSTSTTSIQNSVSQESSYIDNNFQSQYNNFTQNLNIQMDMINPNYQHYNPLSQHQISNLSSNQIDSTENKSQTLTQKLKSNFRLKSKSNPNIIATNGGDIDCNLIQL